MIIHVAVGVIINQKDQILLSRRSADQHQGNKWEFPGGKVEENENSQQALLREIKEELGIEVQSARQITDIIHIYEADDPKDSKKVLLDVYEVREWVGEPEGLEGQPTRWVEREELTQLEFPAANKKIIDILTR